MRGRARCSIRNYANNFNFFRCTRIILVELFILYIFRMPRTILHVLSEAKFPLEGEIILKGRSFNRVEFRRNLCGRSNWDTPF